MSAVADAVTRTALAAITNGQGGFVLDRVSVRAPIGDEVRVALGAAGVCHTDYASLSWDGPLVAGHEGAGWVEAVGPDGLLVARGCWSVRAVGLTGLLVSRCFWSLGAVSTAGRVWSAGL